MRGCREPRAAVDEKEENEDKKTRRRRRRRRRRKGDRERQRETQSSHRYVIVLCKELVIIQDTFLPDMTRTAQVDEP